MLIAPEQRLEVFAPVWKRGALGIACIVALSGCGEKINDKSATQVAAKVNDAEISVHQVNYLLQRQPNIRSEQIDTASRQILDRLIDQELVLQKAKELDVHRDPEVMMALEVARREVMAREYLERVSREASPPTKEEAHAYYKSQPALFSERRVYQFEEFWIDTAAADQEALLSRLRAAKSRTDILDDLKASRTQFSRQETTRAAEQLPLSELDTFAKLTVGQSVVKRVPAGLHVVVLASFRQEPIDEATATPAIEQFLLNERKRILVDERRSTWRKSAKLEYIGKFRQAIVGAGTPIALSDPPLNSGAGGQSIDHEAFRNGLKGFK